MRLGKSDKLHTSTETYISEDYDKFKWLGGNRNVDKKHVQKLVHSIETRGNLTDQFPIVVNERYEILDGQHRFEALKELGEPIVYIIKPKVGINEVRDINTTHRNWTWLDYARSYADLGNEDYEQILSLYEEYGQAFSVLMVYTGGTENRSRSSEFYDGRYEVDDYAHARKLLGMLKEAQQAASNVSRPLSIALKSIFEQPRYNHERMLKKLRKYSEMLEHAHNIKEYRRALEDIYNKGQRAGTIERLF